MTVRYIAKSLPFPVFNYIIYLRLKKSENKYKEYSSKLVECEYRLKFLEIDNTFVEKNKLEDILKNDELL